MTTKKSNGTREAWMPLLNCLVTDDPKSIAGPDGRHASR
jgi:hypothetical protein